MRKFTFLVSILIAQSLINRVSSQLDLGARIDIPMSKDHFKSAGSGGVLKAYLPIVSRFGMGFQASYLFYLSSANNVSDYQTWGRGICFQGNFGKKKVIQINASFLLSTSTFETDPIEVGKTTYHPYKSQFSHTYWSIGGQIEIFSRIYGIIEYYLPINESEYEKGYSSQLLTLGLVYRPWNLDPIFNKSEND